MTEQEWTLKDNIFLLIIYNINHANMNQVTACNNV